MMKVHILNKYNCFVYLIKYLYLIRFPPIMHVRKFWGKIIAKYLHNCFSEITVEFPSKSSCKLTYNWVLAKGFRESPKIRHGHLVTKLELEQQSSIVFLLSFYSSVYLFPLAFFVLCFPKLLLSNVEMPVTHLEIKINIENDQFGS